MDNLLWTKNLKRSSAEITLHDLFYSLLLSTEIKKILHIYCILYYLYLPTIRSIIIEIYISKNRGLTHTLVRCNLLCLHMNEFTFNSCHAELPPHYSSHHRCRCMVQWQRCVIRRGMNAGRKMYRQSRRARCESE